MLNKLNFAEQRYIQIEGEMNDPEIAANPTEFTKRIKEYNSLTPVISKFRELYSLILFVNSVGFAAISGSFISPSI